MSGSVGAILFTCPSTGFTVQSWLEDDERASEDDFEGIICPICKGRVLGHDED